MVFWPAQIIPGWKMVQTSGRRIPVTMCRHAKSFQEKKADSTLLQNAVWNKT
jgi:hypothetical protein